MTTKQFEADAKKLGAMLAEARKFASARGWLFCASGVAINLHATGDELVMRNFLSIATSQPQTTNATILDMARAFYVGVVLSAQRLADAVDKDIAADLKARGFDMNGVMQ